MNDSQLLHGELSAAVAAKLGLNFPPDRWAGLERALQPAARELGFARLDDFVRWLRTARLTPGQMEAIASRLTVGETYFLREPQAFEALRDHVIPELVSTRGGSARLRVWSAGCCTGEEAYSLAIFFQRECPGLQGWQIDILGTDINPHFLRKARAGIYRSWSFRNAPAWLQRDYFTRVGDDRFELRADIRARVAFEHVNLAEDPYPALHNHTNGLDLIFCRNVLMYFSAPQVSRVLTGFHRALMDGGHLVLGVCETALTPAADFRARSFSGVTLYQKSARARAPAPARTPAWIDLPQRLPPVAGKKTAAPALPGPLQAQPASLERAEALYGQGDYAAAAEHAKAILATGPLDIPAVRLLAHALANLGRLADARQWIERALVVHKLDAPLHYLRATVLQEQGEREGAAAALESALYLEPDHVLAHVALAELAGRAGRQKKARRHLAQALLVLRSRAADQIMPDAEGLTAGRLTVIVEAMQAAANDS